MSWILLPSMTKVAGVELSFKNEAPACQLHPIGIQAGSDERLTGGAPQRVDGHLIPRFLRLLGGQVHQDRLIQQGFGKLLTPGRRVEARGGKRSEEHTSELQSLMRSSYAVFCLKKKKTNTKHNSV